MTDADRILTEFTAAWSAGERPDPDAYIDRAAPEERHELSRQISMFLAVAPEPEYDAATWAALEADPLAARAAALPLEPEPWPALLPRLRERAGLSVAQLAERLGFAPSPRRDKAARYLERMEAGTLEPARVTETLLERLAGALGVPAGALDWRGFPAAPAAPAAAAPAPVYRGAPAEAVNVLADALLSGPDPWDEVDELFLGGRAAREGDR